MVTTLPLRRSGNARLLGHEHERSHTETDHCSEEHGRQDGEVHVLRGDESHEGPHAGGQDEGEHEAEGKSKNRDEILHGDSLPCRSAELLNKWHGQRHHDFSCHSSLPPTVSRRQREGRINRTEYSTRLNYFCQASTVLFLRINGKNSQDKPKNKPAKCGIFCGKFREKH